MFALCCISNWDNPAILVQQIGCQALQGEPTTTTPISGCSQSTRAVDPGHQPPCYHWNHWEIWWLRLTLNMQVVYNSRLRHNCCWQNQENGESYYPSRSITLKVCWCSISNHHLQIVVSTHFKHNLSLPGTSIIPGIQLHVPPDPKCRSLLYVANLVLPNMDGWHYRFTALPMAMDKFFLDHHLLDNAPRQNKQWRKVYEDDTQDACGAIGHAWYGKAQQARFLEAADDLVASDMHIRPLLSLFSLFVYAHPCTTFQTFWPLVPQSRDAEKQDAHGIGF